MSEESRRAGDNEADAAASNQLELVAEKVGETLDSIVGDCDAASVFSEPRQVGEKVYITASAIQKAGGFGFGGGSNDDEAAPKGRVLSSGGGGGGGGGGQGRPVAVIEIGPGGVEIKPIIDATKIALVVITSILTVWKALRK